MIRNATINDFKDILILSKEFWSCTDYEEPFDEDHVNIMIHQCHEHGLLAVLEIDAVVVGFVAGIKAFLLGSPNSLCGSEVAWYVIPSMRKGRQGIKLLQFIENLAKEQGVKYWSMVSMECSNPKSAESIYKSMGYTKKETTYTKVLF